MTKKIAISTGHNPDNKGKTIGTISEYSEMAPVVGLITSALEHHGYKAYIIGTGRLEQKVEHINSIRPDIAIELHLNAGGGHGHETLFCPGSSEGKKLAEIINSKMQDHIGIRDRGVKEGWYKMNKENGADYFLKVTNCPSVITEAYFIDNDEEVECFGQDMLFYSNLAMAISHGIIEYLESDN